MNAYSAALFLHVTGAAGYFAALGLEWTGLRRIRDTASAEPAREWLAILATVRKVAFVSMFTAAVTGLYMMRETWGGTPWLLATLVALLLLIVLTAAVAGPRMARLGRAAVGESAAPQQIRGLAGHPSLRISLHSRVAVALGIVFLKSAKPDLGGSLAVLGVAVLLGAVSALAVRGHPAVPEPAGGPPAG